MKKQEIISQLKNTLIEIIPELGEEGIDNYETFVDLGTNSIDRGELIAITLEILELEVPRIEFVSAQNIDELSELILQFQSS